MYNKILLAFDGSTVSLKALQHAVKLTEKLDSEKLYIIHAINTVPMIEPMTGMQMFSMIEIDDKKILDEAIDYLKQVNIDFEVRSMNGDPASLLTHYAMEQDIDLIIMGSTGRGAIRKALLGSVSSHVIQTAPCPVLIVK